MAKRGSPALYELIRARGHEPPVPPTQAAPLRDRPADETPPLPGHWLRPGRLLHIPLGYVFIALAAAIVLASLAYMVGYSRGKGESRHIAAEEAERYYAYAGAQPVPRDPLDSHGNAAAEPGDPRPAAAVRGAGAATAERRSSSQRWGPIESDPRERGLYYLMLMTTNRSGAERFIEFARERGLETYMIPANNRFFRVFALPGFEDHNSNAAAVFREEVLRLGRMYQEQTRERRNPVEMSEWNLYVSRQ